MSAQAQVKNVDLIQIAVSSNNVEMVRLLLQQGANVNAINDFGETPLHLAIALAKDYNVCRLLLERSADLQNRNADSKTPLHTFFSPVVKQVLSRHCDYIDLSALDRNGMSILHFLAWSSKTTNDEFRDFYERSQTNLGAVNTDGLSLLHLAAQRGNLGVVQYLAHTCKDFYALVSLQDSRGRTALHYTMESKRGAQVATLLLSCGAEFGARDHEGRLVLHHAAKLGRLPAVKGLVAALNADLADQLCSLDIWELTPEMVAMVYAKDDVATFLKGETARLLEMDPQAVTKHCVKRRGTWSRHAISPGRPNGEADALLLMPTATAMKEEGADVSFKRNKTLEFGSWSKRGLKRWPTFRLSGCPGQLNARYVWLTWIITSVIVIWMMIGALLISPLYNGMSGENLDEGWLNQ
ncbi:MAG: hypothetical protein Q9186_004630 [Xanthomendoza sp. 1 TL-2023]